MAWDVGDVGMNSLPSLTRDGRKAMVHFRTNRIIGSKNVKHCHIDVNIRLLIAREYIDRYVSLLPREPG